MSKARNKPKDESDLDALDPDFSVSDVSAFEDDLAFSAADDSDDVVMSDSGDGDPLAAVDYTGRVELDALSEASELLKAFKQQAKAELARFNQATDSEYWVAVCFLSREQKEEFLKRANLFDLGDKYLNGIEVARILGIELPDADVRFRSSKIDSTLASMARDYE